MLMMPIDLRYLLQHHQHLLIAYALFFVAITLLCVALNASLLRRLRHIGIHPKQDADNWVRWAATPKPAIGGIGLWFAFVSTLLAYPLFQTVGISLQVPPLSEFLLFVAACTVGFSIGLIDDIRPLHPLFKFGGQLVCALLFIGGGIIIPICNITGINALFTAIWVVGIMNALNMLDNMDGITASVSFFILLNIVLMAALNQQLSLIYCLVAVGTMGGIIGFLRYNWHSSSMFMGDAGSQFLGALLSGLSILYLWQFRDTQYGIASLRQLLLPAIVFMLPLIDTVTVTIRRLARGQSPFVGGRDHTTHHLAYCGLRDNQVAYVFVLLSVLGVCLAYYTRNRLFTAWSIAHTAAIVTYMLSVFVAFQVLYEYGKRKAMQKKGDF